LGGGKGGTVKVLQRKGNPTPLLAKRLFHQGFCVKGGQGKMLKKPCIPLGMNRPGAGAIGCPRGEKERQVLGEKLFATKKRGTANG